VFVIIDSKQLYLSINPNYLMKPLFKAFTLFVLLIIALSSCQPPQHFVGNFDLNNLKPGIDSFKKRHPIIHNGDMVTINILNVNKDLYTVKLTPNAVSFNTEIPSALSLSSLVLPGAAGNLAAGSSAFHRQQYSCVYIIDSLMEKVRNAERVFEGAEDNINKLIAFNNHLLLLQKDCGISARQIKETADDELSGIMMGDSVSDLPGFIQDNLATADGNYKAIDKTIPIINSYFACDSCKTGIKLHKATNFNDDDKAEIAAIKDNYTKITAFEQSGQAYITVQDYKAVTNPANYTVSAFKAAHNADEISFDVQISPKNWLPCRPVDTSFNIKLKVARFKIDFSTGIFMNFGGTRFAGKNYFIDSTGTVKQIAKNANNYIPSIGALAHFYYRSGAVIDPGLVLGASLSTDVKYTNFHIGLSCMFNANNGLFNRVALSGGLTYRYVQELNSAYPVGTMVDKSLTIDQIETGKFMPGGFIALTYNLSKN
jgi:hypothetical protein